MNMLFDRRIFPFQFTSQAICAYISEGTLRENVFMLFYVLIFGIIIRDSKVITTSHLSCH